MIATISLEEDMQLMLKANDPISLQPLPAAVLHNRF
jgi:hypothetical protein